MLLNDNRWYFKLTFQEEKKNENTTEVSTVNDYNSILKIVKGTTLFQSTIHNLAD